VETVNPTGPGYKAGLRAGDHILRIDDLVVEGSNHEHIVRLLKESRQNPTLRLQVKYTSDFRRVELNRKLINCRKALEQQQNEVRGIQQMEEALTVASQQGTFESTATAFHQQALLTAARQEELAATTQRSVFSRQAPDGGGKWIFYTAEESAAIAAARTASPLQGRYQLSEFHDQGTRIEIRWGLSATSAKLSQPPVSGMIQVDKSNDDATQVVKCEFVGPSGAAINASSTPASTPFPPTTTTAATAPLTTPTNAARVGALARRTPTATNPPAPPLRTSSVPPSTGGPASLGSLDLCTVAALDLYPPADWDAQMPHLLLAMQDQWKAERVKWEKREADLLMQVATVQAVAAQNTTDLNTLRAVNEAKSKIPIFTAAVERTSISEGRKVLNLDMPEGRPDSVVDNPKRLADSLSPSGNRWSVQEEADWAALNEITSMVHATTTAATASATSTTTVGVALPEEPSSPSQATLNQRISWSSFGEGMLAAAGGGGAAESPTVAPIPSAGSDDDDDDLPPMPDANPPQVPADMPKKYTATEWV
jgi:hypothetical protein